MKKYLIPPLFPVLILLLFCVWVVASEQNSTPRYHDGRPDNAPMRAALLGFFISPLVYVLACIANIADILLRRIMQRRPWTGTAMTILGFTLAISILGYLRAGRTSPLDIALFLLAWVFFIAPMTILRTFVTHRKKNAEP